MRYGSPSIDASVASFLERGITELVVFSLYPQFSPATTESTRSAVHRVVENRGAGLRVRFIDTFFRDKGFIEAYAKRAEESLKNYSHDFLLFSFHGLPEGRVKKADASGCHCLSRSDCCEPLTAANQNCYRAQCLETARLLAARLGLPVGRYATSFQSRLGSAEWIKPYTAEFYEQLAKRGVRRLAVMCPAFAADCVETLEEISIRGRAQFIAHGGEDLRLVPSLNSSEDWAQVICRLVNGP
jgi:ferrochelatase